MARPRRRARRQASKRLAPFYRMTFIILMGAVAARLIILGIDALGARTGLPGGELFIPLYIIIAPVFGWQLRGWTAIGSHPKLPPRCTFAGRICVTRHGGHQAQLLARDHRAA